MTWQLISVICIRAVLLWWLAGKVYDLVSSLVFAHASVGRGGGYIVTYKHLALATALFALSMGWLGWPEGLPG